jgi:hypothetical protein
MFQTVYHLFWSTLDERFKTAESVTDCELYDRASIHSRCRNLSLYKVLTGFGTSWAFQGYGFLGCDTVRLVDMYQRSAGAIYQSSRRQISEYWSNIRNYCGVNLKPHSPAFYNSIMGLPFSRGKTVCPNPYSSKVKN